MRFKVVFISCVLFLVGCTSTPIRDVFSLKATDVKKNTSNANYLSNKTGSLYNASPVAQQFNGVKKVGSGNFINRKSKISINSTDTGKHSLNLVNAPIQQVIKAVLGDTLGVNYVIDGRVKGNMTLQTTSAVSESQLSDILESALAINGAGIVNRAGTFHVLPLSEVLSPASSVTANYNQLRGPGIVVQVIQLQHIAAEEMKVILEPVSRKGSVLRADSTKNYIILAGTSVDLNSMREMISMFDVDWMRGMSVAIHPLKTSSPEAITTELETIFGKKKSIVKFIPNNRLNAILVLSSRPAYLDRAAHWIRKLDRVAQNNENQLFVYQIQNRPAKELSSILQSILKPQSSGNGKTNTSPNFTQAKLEGGGSEEQNKGKTNEGLSLGFNSVVADVENNALLIQTTSRKYKRIKKILEQLDVLPTQVLLEAVIAEVTLNDELKFGLRWFFESKGMSVSLTDVAANVFGPSFPGFSWGYNGPNISVTLNALSSVTDVKVVSAPTVMALNNQEAVLQVGDQVPIVVQTATGTGSGNALIVNKVELRDTGVILKVTPRVNKAGRVTLNIEQEVSTVEKTTSSGIDSPTIRRRRISTRVLVNDGETAALGGLIQESNSLTRGQIPILGDIPLFGNAFKNKTDKIVRTELIIFIRPRVIRDIREARNVTDEFRRQLNFNTSLDRRRGGKNKLHQDIKRLVN